MSSRPPTPRATGPAEIPIERVYGLDIETDTSVDGLDPEVGAVVAVAVATERGERVFDGPENQLLTELDHFMSSLPAGIVVTWYGSGFDLPYLARRAEILPYLERLRDRAGRRDERLHASRRERKLDYT